jgi:hypothetical protein
LLKSSELVTLLSNPCMGKELQRAIRSAMPDFLRGLAELGRSAPLILEEEGRSHPIEREQVLNLCAWFLDGEITCKELEYIASLLDLSQDFQCSAEVGDAIFRLSDPVANGQITVESVRGILATLRGAT